MKRRYWKLLILILSFTTYFYSQDKPEAQLVDMYGKINCEDVLARTDNFFIRLQQYPNSQGYIIIEVDDNNIRNGLEYEQIINGQIRLRGYDKSRLTIVRSSSKKEELKVTHWLIPQGAELPEFSATKWDLSFPKNKKPFIFSQNYNDSGICPSPEELDINLFAEYLIANPNARGNIVIKTPLMKKFRTEKQNLITLISDKYKISDKRIRFFHIKKQNYYDSEYPEVEIWILP